MTLAKRSPSERHLVSRGLGQRDGNSCPLCFGYPATPGFFQAGGRHDKERRHSVGRQDTGCRRTLPLLQFSFSRCASGQGSP